MSFNKLILATALFASFAAYAGPPEVLNPGTNGGDGPEGIGPTIYTPRTLTPNEVLLSGQTTMWGGSFFSMVKTDTTTGQPMVQRSGLWIPADQRIAQLEKAVHDNIKAFSGKKGDTDKLIQTLNDLGIADNAWTGNSYQAVVANVHDPKLLRILSLEWFLGQGSSLARNSTGITHSEALPAWAKYGEEWFKEGNEDMVLRDLHKAHKFEWWNASPQTGELILRPGMIGKVIFSTAAIAGAAVLTNALSTGHAEAAETVGAPNNKPSQPGYSDSQFSNTSR